MFARFAILLPSLAALGVCLWGIQSRQVWRDEHATWWAATLPTDALFRLLSHIDAVIGPYYLMMRPVVALLGASALALRLPSALAVALCTGALALLGKRLFGARIGIVAGLLLAIIPKVSRYGQEARPYAFTLLLTVVTVLLLLRALREPRALRFAAYTGSVVLLGATHLIALCSLAAHPILLLTRSEPAGRWRVERRALLGFVAASSLALLVLAPFAYLGTQQIAQISWTNRISQQWTELPGMLFTAPKQGRAFFLLGLCALWRPTRERCFVAGWAVLPLTFLYLSSSTLHLFIHRYMLFVLPAWCLLAAIGIDDLGRLVARVTRQRLLVYAVAALLVAFLTRRGLHKQREVRANLPSGRAFDYASVGAQLRQRAAAGDAIAFQGASDAAQWARMAMQYELRDRATPRDVFVRASAAEIGELYAYTCQAPAACLPTDVQRLWLVTCTDPGSRERPVDAALTQLLADQFVVRRSQSFYNLELALLERRPAVASSLPSGQFP